MTMRPFLLPLAFATLALPSAGRGQQAEREREREAERRAEARERDLERRAEARARATEARARELERRLRDEAEDSRLDTTIAFAKGGLVDLSLFTGDIIVRAWSRPELQVRASVEHGRIDADLTRDRVTMSARSSHGSAGTGSFSVQVPVGTRVIARGMSADINVTGVQASVEARSTSGDVTVQGAADRVSIESISGDVTGRSLNGSVTAAAVSGDVELDQVTGDVDVSTVSGDISLDRVTSRDVGVESVSGAVEFSGGFDKAGRYEFHTHSGDITLSIPDGVGASLSLETFSGEIDTAYPITIQPSNMVAPSKARRGRGTRRLETTLAGGGARIVAESFGGNITIEKDARR